jgi:serine/threonine protein kinase
MDTLISKLFNNQLHLQNHLGYENNTEVYEGKYNNNSNMLDVIVKMISRKDTPNFEQILIEIGFLRYLSKFKSSLQYINICYGVKLTDDYLIVILERPLGVTLKEFLANTKDITINQYNKLSCAIMFRLLLAINYIHEKGVAHRGINPETIYINYKDGLIESIKITDFAVSCGNYIGLTNKNENENNVYNKLCKTLHQEISPPEVESFKINSLINKIKELKKDETRETIYLYFAKKADIWALGILFWKLLNRNDMNQNPLDFKFPGNYQSDKSWKIYRGNKNKLIKKLFLKVIQTMLSEIPQRGKSSEILEEFVTITKYVSDDENNNY